MDETTPMAQETPQGEPAPMHDEQPAPAPHEKRSMGPVIGSIIIIAVIVIGGLYLYGQQVVKNEGAGMTAEEIEAQADPELEELQEQGISTDLDSIESDLDANSFDDIDAELGDLDW